MKLSKKDLVILAVLVNIGILTLIITFATTSTQEKIQKEAPVQEVVSPPKEEVPHTQVEAPKQEVTPVKEVKPTSFDEIDELLEEYIPVHEPLAPPASPPVKKEVVKKKPVPLPKPLPKKSIPKAQPTPKEQKKEPPSTEQKKAPPPTPKQEKTTEDDRFYVVQPGDNPWKIAKKFHISYEKFLELNNLNEQKAKNLKIGQRLKIREDQ